MVVVDRRVGRGRVSLDQGHGSLSIQGKLSSGDHREKKETDFKVSWFYLLSKCRELPVCNSTLRYLRSLFIRFASHECK